MRRAFWGISLLISLISGCTGTSQALLVDSGWKDYKQAFVKSGAVQDTGNKGVSHSEGQGYAMLLAHAYGDQKSFEQLWQWTRKHLQTRQDKLFSWRWSESEGVTDPNNATDGDILIAWALLRAAESWSQDGYRKEAMAILSDIKLSLIVEQGDYQLLLPGEYGFDKEEGYELNLAYWVFPALEHFQKVDPQGPWQALVKSGDQLIQAASWGPRKLIPDWVFLDDLGRLYPSPGRPERFGYEVVRVPLYIAWSRSANLSNMAPIDGFWAQFQAETYVPAWIALDDSSKAEYPAPRGFDAIRVLTRRALNQTPVSAPPDDLAPDLTKQDYYSASLLLLSRLAWTERFSK